MQAKNTTLSFVKGVSSTPTHSDDIHLFNDVSDEKFKYVNSSGDSKVLVTEDQLPGFGPAYALESELIALSGDLQDQIDTKLDTATFAALSGSSDLQAQIDTKLDTATFAALSGGGSGGTDFTPLYPLILEDDDLELVLDPSSLESALVEGVVGAANISGCGILSGIQGNSLVDATVSSTDAVWRAYDNSNQYTGWTPGFNYQLDFTVDEKVGSDDWLFIYFLRNFSFGCGNVRADIPNADRMYIQMNPTYNGGTALRYGYNQTSGGDGIGYKPWSAGQRVRVTIDTVGFLTYYIDSVFQFTYQLSEDYHDILFATQGTSDINFSDYQWGSPGLTLVDSGVTNGTYTYPNITVDAKGRLTSASDGTTPLLPSNDLSDVSDAPAALSNLGGVSLTSLNALSGDYVNIIGDTMTGPLDIDGTSAKISVENTNGGTLAEFGDGTNSLRIINSSNIQTLQTIGSNNTLDIVRGGSSRITLSGNSVIVGNGTTTDLDVRGDVEVEGDLVVNGTTTTVNSEEVLIEDNIITLNSNMSGSPPSFLESGIKVNRGDEDPYYFTFNEDNLTFSIGVSGISGDERQAVATREDGIVDNNLVYWDANDNIFRDMGISTPISGGFVKTIGDTMTGPLTIKEDISNTFPIELLNSSDNGVKFNINGGHTFLNFTGASTNYTLQGFNTLSHNATKGVVIAGDSSKNYSSSNDVRIPADTTIDVGDFLINEGDLTVTSISGAGGNLLTVDSNGKLIDTGIAYDNISEGISISGAEGKVLTTNSSNEIVASHREIAGVTWSSVDLTLPISGANNPDNNDSWTSVCYGNGLFVAVSNSGDRVMTSPDGINWTVRTAASDNDFWASVCYGNGLFVAVGSGGGSDRVITSPDGINWTARTADSDFTEVIYAKGMFVAGGSNGAKPVFTSVDGVTWVDVNANITGLIDCLTYGNGLFVAGGTGGSSNDVWVSEDAIDWTQITITAGYWQSVVYANGLFVLADNQSDKIITSPDGYNWTVNNVASGDWNSLVYGDGLFVVVGWAGNRIMTSPDGFTWTNVDAAGNNDTWNCVTYGNGMFVVVGNSGDRVMISGKMNEIHTDYLNDKEQINRDLVVNGALTVSGDISGANFFGDGSNLSNLPSEFSTTTNPSISGSSQELDSLADTSADASEWLVSIKSDIGTNIRASKVLATWDASNTVVYTETSTTDIGDTSDVVLSVDENANNIRLLATTTSGQEWNIKTKRTDL